MESAEVFFFIGRPSHSVTHFTVTGKKSATLQWMLIKGMLDHISKDAFGHR
jgi:hypothetical protein